MSDLFREEALDAHARWLALIGSPRLSPLLSRRVWFALGALLVAGALQAMLIAELAQRTELKGELAIAGAQRAELSAPASGVEVLDLAVSAGQRVRAGEVLMSVQHVGTSDRTNLVAPTDGVVATLAVQRGGRYAGGATLAILEPAQAALEAHFPIADAMAATLRPGERMTVRVSARNQQKVELAGTIERLWRDESGDADLPLRLSVRIADVAPQAAASLAGLPVAVTLPGRSSLLLRQFERLQRLFAGDEDASHG